MGSPLLFSEQEFAGVFYQRSCRQTGGEAETSFRWFGSEHEGRKERKAETTLLKSLHLKGIKETVGERDGGAREKNLSPFASWGASWRSQARAEEETQEGGRQERSEALRSEPQRFRGKKKTERKDKSCFINDARD